MQLTFITSDVSGCDNVQYNWRHCKIIIPWKKILCVCLQNVTYDKYYNFLRIIKLYEQNIKCAFVN